MSNRTKVQTVLLAASVLWPSLVIANQWVYKKEKEALTDKSFSYAAGFEFDYQYNNDFTLSFECSNGKLSFTINVDTLINSKSEPFSFAYRVDKREARQLNMRTYSNEGQGGFTRDNVKRIANDFLGGSSVFVRAITWDNDYLEATVRLSGADAAIKRVFADCGVALSDEPKPTFGYSFDEFERSYGALTPSDQEKILKELEELMRKHAKR